MEEINTDIIIEQIEGIIERAISENEAVLVSLGIEHEAKINYLQNQEVIVEAV